MKVVDVSCHVIGTLMTRWYDHTLTDVESDVYEQHILLCPPCLNQAGKLRVALTALTALATASDVASVDLVSRLVAVIHADPGAGI